MVVLAMGASATDAAFFCFVIRSISCHSSIYTKHDDLFMGWKSNLSNLYSGNIVLISFISVVFLLTALIAYGVCTRTEFYQHYLGEKTQDFETKEVSPSILISFLLEPLPA